MYLWLDGVNYQQPDTANGGVPHACKPQNPKHQRTSGCQNVMALGVSSDKLALLLNTAILFVIYL